MKILVDLQSVQTEARFHGIGRYAVDFSLALAQQDGDVDIWLVVNTAYPDSARELRALFAPWVPPERIVNFAPPAPLEPDVFDDRPRRTAAELIWAHLLRSVEPDCVIVASLIYSLNSHFVTCASDRTEAPDVEARTAIITCDLIPWLRPDIYLTDPVSRQFYEEKLVAMRAAALLLAISESSRQEALRHLDAPPHRVATISGAASDQFSPAPPGQPPQEALAELGISRPFLLYAPSGMDPRKNIERLIESYGQLAAELRATHQLVITSKFSASDQERLRIAGRRAGLGSDELVLTGYVTDAQLIALYRTTELFVYPSLHEGFGLPVLEAMACGAPVIGSNRTSVPEIIGREEALFDPTSRAAITEAMTAALTDATFRASMRDHGPVQAKKFSWSRTAGLALAAVATAFVDAPPLAARPEDDLLRDLVAVLAPRPDLLPLVAQSVATSRYRSDRQHSLFVDVTGLDKDPIQVEDARAQEVEVAPGEPARLVRRGDTPVIPDLRPGDILVVAAAGQLADPTMRAAYVRAQAHGVRLAVPIASLEPLLDVLRFLSAADIGIFCADETIRRAALRAAQDVVVHQVDGSDVRAATVKALAAP
jgi:glycosyltransferase involved in cell wall biosynthesis